MTKQRLFAVLDGASTAGPQDSLRQPGVASCSGPFRPGAAGRLQARGPGAVALGERVPLVGGLGVGEELAGALGCVRACEVDVLALAGQRAGAIERRGAGGRRRPARGSGAFARCDAGHRIDGLLGDGAVVALGASRDDGAERVRSGDLVLVAVGDQDPRGLRLRLGCLRGGRALAQDGCPLAASGHGLLHEVIQARGDEFGLLEQPGGDLGVVRCGQVLRGDGRGSGGAWGGEKPRRLERAPRRMCTPTVTRITLEYVSVGSRIRGRTTFPIRLTT